MRVVVQHRSRYIYPRSALLGPQVIRLRPADHTRAAIETYSLTITPEHRVHWQRDPYGNRIARVTFKAGQEVPVFDITVELTVDMRPINPFDFFVDDRAKQVPFTYPDQLASELAGFLDTQDPAYRLGKLGVEFLKGLPAAGVTVDFIVEMCQAVQQRTTYVIRNEPGIWTPEETLGHGRGSCRDSAVLLVAVLRSRGIAARFASGYLIQLEDEGMLPDEPKGVTHDVVDLHAWAEAFIPGAGWIGLDATSGLLTGEGHIPLACTATPGNASPLVGTSDVPADAVEFSTTVTRLGHEARPTAPFTEHVWTELLAAGDRADAMLTAAKLEVTVGGEPTFTARAGASEASWEGGALGPDKWKKGRALAERLRDELAPGGVVVHRMGKHYPGESMPRWALEIIGRRDGTALWPVRAVELDLNAARTFAHAISSELGVAATWQPAFEDPWEVIRSEAALPPMIDPQRAPLDDPEERRRLARVLNRGVGKEVAWVLPLARSVIHASAGWQTETWQFRREHLFLVPGDSPVGLRLPLDSVVAGAPPPVWKEAPAFPDPRTATPAQPKIEKISPAPFGIVPRTAIVVEPRDGTLWVFVPPVPSFEDFCALVTAIDRARAVTGLDCSIEGYGPPPHPQQFKFAVTPDPGVLEVNLPPVTSCRAAAELHARVFALALENGLTAERYLLDGRAAGSGGGNHITIGGPNAARSPWFARPELLASLVTFTQHHPSLSYMFTGLFVGPTSQAPRLDEARHDALTELELAIPTLFGKPPVWQVDALLRNLLVDVAGSTHRAELSIDKLYDPNTPFGRQGLVEFRAFEMPPHPRMCAAQVVLIRAMVAAFTKAPYRHDLVRWGEALHDRFLLPYFMWQDFTSVLGYLAQQGLELPAAAFEPFVELRCPLVGALPIGEGRLELRNAIEPWHVLGEEAGQGGTARYVDSSLERVEVRTIGLDHERYAVSVNGFALPMRAASGREVRVGGVKFRAWAPPHSLQPQYGIHHPLKFDVVDTWASRAVGAATYHVWHPEGRGYSAPPLTRVEAAARRSQRFTTGNPTASPVHTKPTAANPDQPYTLDLRRVSMGTPPPAEGDYP